MFCLLLLLFVQTTIDHQVVFVVDKILNFKEYTFVTLNWAIDMTKV